MGWEEVWWAREGHVRKTPDPSESLELLERESLNCDDVGDDDDELGGPDARSSSGTYWVTITNARTAKPQQTNPNRKQGRVRKGTPLLAIRECGSRKEEGTGGLQMTWNTSAPCRSRVLVCWMLTFSSFSISIAIPFTIPASKRSMTEGKVRTRTNGNALVREGVPMTREARPIRDSLPGV